MYITDITQITMRELIRAYNKIGGEILRRIWPILAGAVLLIAIMIYLDNRKK